jgi:hypothetical protein
MAKRSNQAWQDETGEYNTWEDLVDQVKLQYKINAALQDLLYKHKISVKDIANVTHQAKSAYYGWKKETKFKPTIMSKTDDKPKNKDAKPKKKSKKNKNKN